MSTTGKIFASSELLLACSNNSQGAKTLAWVKVGPPSPNGMRGISHATDSVILTPPSYRPLVLASFVIETLHRCPHPQYIPKTLNPYLRSGPVRRFDGTPNLICGPLVELEWVSSSTCSNLIDVMLVTKQLETKWRGSELLYGEMGNLHDFF